MKFLGHLGALLLLSSIFLVPLIDTDFGWHYRCGEQIVKQGKLCDVNSFTTLLSGYHWTSPSHGYQVLLYLLFQLGGFPAISLFYGISAALVIFLFFKSLAGNLWLKFSVFLPLLWFAELTLNLGFRSQVLSFYFLMILLSLLELSPRKPRVLWLTIPLMILWANAHPGFFLGPLVISLYLLTNLTKLIFKKIEPAELFRKILILSLAALATLINPFGLGIYQEAWRHAVTPLNTLIVEWLPPFDWQKYFLIGSSLVTALIFLKTRAVNLFRLGVLVLTAVLALEARRSLSLFSAGLTFALFEPKLAAKLSSFFEKISSRELLLAVFGSLFLYRLSLLPTALSLSEQTYCQKALVAMPCAAVEILKTKKPTRVFNAYEWGGFLEWQLPDFKFFVDGRMPTWDTTSEMRLPESWRNLSPYTIHLNLLYAVPGWDKILSNFQTKYLLIPPNNELEKLLRVRSTEFGYREIFRDGVSILYEKIN